MYGVFGNFTIFRLSELPFTKYLPYGERRPASQPAQSSSEAILPCLLFPVSDTSCNVATAYFFFGHFWDLFQVCTVIVYSVVLYSKLETSPTPYTPNKHLIAPPLCPEGQPSWSDHVTSTFDADTLVPMWQPPSCENTGLAYWKSRLCFAKV